MRLSGLLGSQQETLPGITGTARLQRRDGALPQRIAARDIVFLDRVDLDRRTAETLVAHEVSAVINASSSISGKYPNLGPEVLLAAGVKLIDDVGPEALRGLRDGATVRLHSGGVFLRGKRGEELLVHGSEQDAETVAARMSEAKSAMSARVAEFSTNTAEFLRRERMLVLDGIGVPEVRVEMLGRHVLVLAPGEGHAVELGRLRRYVREHCPVLIGVSEGADTLRAHGLTPDVIVGDPTLLTERTLGEAGEVVIPAGPDGHAPGTARVQELGIGAVTFPAGGNPEDLALLLADVHGAALVVIAGSRASLEEFLDRERSLSNPSTFLTRMRLAGKVVDGSAAMEFERSRLSNIVFLVLAFGVLLMGLLALAASGVGAPYLTVLGGFAEAVLEFCTGMIT
ncbi:MULTISPECIES: putative cytokinetic ring protein SteA [unclassified Actinopolyspora]|uniref:putative cytokinetic ring protein SteA n=1 Tax=unclassified Actinopolyspora TaxID=2639451 RepID=UPI0013F5CA23|nr:MULTISPECIES: putative cytokinetic ring protein SteA [unclassified Actinopolyspora]NHD15460.1 thiamine pyrophosphokinase [Actinopolyspora sp. BKK2]NHE75326.1 thiamine pyrophosphokinase [Actinopolyspora sp. BKK1]